MFQKLTIRMTKGFKIFSGILLVCIAFAAVFAFSKNKNQQTTKAISADDHLPIDLNTYQTSIGWAYEIDVDKKPFIKQEQIPAISGRHGFASEDDARTVAKAVIEKIKKGKTPYVTIEELKQLNIQIP